MGSGSAMCGERMRGDGEASGQIRRGGACAACVRAYAISILNRGGRVWRRLRGVRTRIFSDGAAPAAGLHELARRAYAHI